METVQATRKAVLEEAANRNVRPAFVKGVLSVATQKVKAAFPELEFTLSCEMSKDKIKKEIESIKKEYS